MEWYVELLICIPTCCCFCLLVDYLRDKRRARAKRIHHKINWHKTAPKILREECKKAERIL